VVTEHLSDSARTTQSPPLQHARPIIVRDKLWDTWRQIFPHAGVALDVEHAANLEVKRENVFREILLPHLSRLKITCSACSHACYVQDDGYLALKKWKLLINKMKARRELERIN